MPGIFELNINAIFANIKILLKSETFLLISVNLLTGPSECDFKWINKGTSEGDFVLVSCQKHDRHNKKDVPKENREVGSFNQKENRKVQTEETPRSSGDLFLCPEEGCHKSFQRYGALQNHVLYERHDKKRTKLTLLDKAKKGYALRLEEHYGAVPSRPTCNFRHKRGDETTAEAGWALKSKTHGKFNDNQREFLTRKFEEGEKSGNKHKAEEVAKEMRRVKNTEGKRRFTVDEFLTEQQITSFFSRLASKKRKITGPDFKASQEEAMRKELEDNLMKVLSCHPITYEDLDLCNMSPGNIAKLKLVRIKAICMHFGIVDIPGKKKAHYVEKLMSELAKCPCKEG